MLKNMTYSATDNMKSSTPVLLTPLQKFPIPLAIQPEEVELLTPRDRLSVSQWAVAHRRLSPKTSHLHGPWTNEITPFAVEIMDSISSRGVYQTTVQKCTQAGGTEIALNIIGWAVDEEPGPTLMVMPTESDVKRRVATRIKPMFEASPSLLRHVGGDLASINIGGPTETDSMILYLGWSTSPAALADNPICNVLLDEVGKFPPRVRNEADPVSLAKDRQRTYKSRSSLYVASSPVMEGDLIDREYKSGDRREWWMRCVHCGKHHIGDFFKNVSIDKDADKHFLDKDEYLSGGHARYICPHCGVVWTETDRWTAVSDGRWAPAGCTVNDAGGLDGDVKPTAHRSYHISALMLHPMFMTIDQLAADWADAELHYRSGDIGPRQNFFNSQLGVPWTESGRTVDENILETHRSNYVMGTVPYGVQMIVAGYDVQMDHVWYLVLGLGYLGEKWIITADRIETGDTTLVENYLPCGAVMRMTWPTVADPNMVYRAIKGGADCAYRPDAVQAWCRSVPEDIVPVRGDVTVKNFIRTTRLTGPARGTELHKIPEASEVRFDLNVDAYKDQMNRSMIQATPGPGYLHIPSDAPMWLLRQLTAWKRVPIRNGRGVLQGFRWVDKIEGNPDHAGDCMVYAIAAAQLAGSATIPNPEAPAPAARRVGGVMDRYRR